MIPVIPETTEVPHPIVQHAHATCQDTHFTFTHTHTHSHPQCMTTQLASRLIQKLKATWSPQPEKASVSAPIVHRGDQAETVLFVSHGPYGIV